MTTGGRDDEEILVRCNECHSPVDLPISAGGEHGGLATSSPNLWWISHCGRDRWRALLQTGEAMTDTRAQPWRILLTTTEPNRWPGFMVVEHDRDAVTDVSFHSAMLGKFCAESECKMCDAARQLLRSTRLRYTTAPKQLDPDAERARIRAKDPACFGPIIIERVIDTPRRRRTDA